MEEKRLELCRYRLERAKDDLSVSKLNLDNKKYSQSINRSYYSMFHAVKALLALMQEESRKHAGIISLFNKYYVKPGYIEAKYFKMLTSAFQIRQDSDYDDFYIATLEEAETQYHSAGLFVERIDTYLDSSLNPKD